MFPPVLSAYGSCAPGLLSSVVDVSKENACCIHECNQISIILRWQIYGYSFQITPTLSIQNFDRHVNFDKIKTNLADFCLDLMCDFSDY
jgi:hypothetical protein